jgi:hypothetical protein
MLHPIHEELRCKLLSNAKPFWAPLHTLCQSAPYWATLHSLSCAASSELRCTLTELSYFIQFLNCRHAGVLAFAQSDTETKKHAVLDPVRNLNKKIQSHIGISDIALKFWWPECQCRRNWHWCRCPAMEIKFGVKRKTCNLYCLQYIGVPHNEKVYVFNVLMYKGDRWWRGRNRTRRKELGTSQ